MRHFLGFEPETKTASSINVQIEKLLAIAPSDTAEDTSIEKHGDLFVGEINLVSSQGIFRARSIERNLLKLTSNIAESVEHQLKNWRVNRTIDNQDLSTEVSNIKNRERFKFGKSVLIIDDDLDSVRILEFALKRTGCFVHFLTDGTKAATEIAKTNFDLIFLDWFMPSINGGETLAQAENLIASSALLQNRGLERKIPVIIYSGHDVDSFEHFPECDFFTFVDIWKKQFNLTQISDRLSQILPNL